MKKYILKTKKGFTLVEMLVAVSLFIAIATLAVGSLVTIFDAGKKAQSSKTVMDNLNFAIDDMTRIIRFGDHYFCGESSNSLSVSNCTSLSGAISVTFEGARIIYRLNATNKSIEKSVDGGANYSSITSPEVKIESLGFFVRGSLSDNQQPSVLAIIKGYVGEKPTIKTSFVIQTFMSQRKLDL